MSDIAWLDTSPDEERRMRELVKMFSDAGTLDDIGIGQVRDSLADQMFPATSTVHARARYFLFIPWIHAAAASKHSGTAILTKARDQERKLIETMKQAGHTQGLIGRVAGASVAILPSSIYSSALRQMGIRDDTAHQTKWNISVDSPDGFPAQVESGFAMSPAEAGWLQERTLATSPSSYLAHLLTAGLDVDVSGVPLPWDHPSLGTASDDVRAVVNHARLFSLAIHGASLLYNLLVAERYEKVKASDGQSYVDDYRDRLSEWSDQIAAESSALAAWDIDAFWAVTNRCPPRSTPIPPATRIFVDQWLAHVRAGEADTVGSSPQLRALIADRERSNKGEQSRLNNDCLLKNWAGAAGAGRLAYRWPNVQTLVGDIAEGLDRAPSR